MHFNADIHYGFNEFDSMLFECHTTECLFFSEVQNLINLGAKCTTRFKEVLKEHIGRYFQKLTPHTHSASHTLFLNYFCNEHNKMSKCATALFEDYYYKKAIA